MLGKGSGLFSQHQPPPPAGDDPFLRPISPVTGSTVQSPPRFCDPDNLQAATDYLNRQLALSSPLAPLTPQAPLVFLNANPAQAADLINLVFALLQQRERDAALRDHVDARMVRLENDYEAMARNLQRHKDKIAQDERELRAQLAKYSKLETAHRDLTDKLKNTLDELKMVKGALVQAKNQFAHDKRKSERELTQIKLKFQKVATDRFKDLKLSYRIANPGPSGAPASSRPAGPRRALHPEDDYHAALLRDVEAREHALLVELDALKRLMHDVWQELQHLLAVAVPDCQVVDLPFELVRETIAHRIRQVVCALRDEWAQAQLEAEGVDELEHARRVVEVQQEEMVQTSAQIEGFKRQVEELKRQMWETGQRMDRATTEWASGPDSRSRDMHHTQQQQQEQQEQQRLDEEEDRVQQHQAARAPAAPATSAPALSHAAVAERFAGRPLSLMSDAGDGARAGLRAQFEQVHAERARLAQEALEVGMERQRLQREKEILTSQRQSGAGGRGMSQLGKVVEGFAYQEEEEEGRDEEEQQQQQQQHDGMDVDLDANAQDLIHALDAAMHPPTNSWAHTPARRPEPSSAPHAAYPPPETPQSHTLHPMGGADASNIRAPAGAGASDLFGMGDVSRIPPTTASATTGNSHATPNSLATASNVWTTPLSAMHPSATTMLATTPQSPGMLPPSQAQHAQGYLKPALRAGPDEASEQQQMTPAAGAAGAGRQVKISPQSMAYYSSSVSGSAPASGMHWQSQMLRQPPQQGVQVPTALGSSTSTSASQQQQQQQRGGYYVDENHTGAGGFGGARGVAGGGNRADNPFGLVRSGSAASISSGRYG